MSKETKRGGPFPSGEQRAQAQELEGYPTWEGWRHTLFEELRGKGMELRDSVEPTLKEYYTKRRLLQLGKIPQEEFMKYVDQLDREKGEIFDDPTNNFAVKFITDRTTKQKQTR